MTCFFHEDKRRPYFACARCSLVSVPPQYHCSLEDEKREYDEHENSPEDLAYRAFLSRLAMPLMTRLVSGSVGLDVGCGPGPTLSVMLEEAGMQVALYDPFYFPERALLDRQYDFVTATEVVEHMRDPTCEWERMWRCVRPGGVLGVMTKLVRNREAFKGWHYKNDPTHIHFYSLNTLGYLAECWGAKLEQLADDAFIFTKPGPGLN